LGTIIVKTPGYAYCRFRRMEKMKFESYGNCFVCGEKNSGGLRLSFEIDKENRMLRTTFIGSPVYQGYDGILHGGIICTLLDEAMAKLCYELGYIGVTASLEVRFKNPAPILEPLIVYGEITEAGKRLVRTKARMVKEDGTVVAKGTSTLLRRERSRPGSP
jgi:acyl-coenzyme A thioesterase PaaI-like protein